MNDIERLEKIAVLLSLPGTALLVLLPLYINDLGGGSELIGIVSSVGPITFSIIRLIGGAATDVFGRKKAFTFGLFLYTSGLLILALASNADTIALGGALSGAGAMIAMTSAIVMVADVSGFAEVYGKLTSKMALGGVIGAVIPFSLLKFLPEVTAFRISFFIYFLTSLYSTLKALELRETKPPVSVISFEFTKEWFAATLIGSLVSIASGMVTPFYPIFVASRFKLNANEVMLTYVPSALSAIGAPRIAGALNPFYAIALFSALGTIGSISIVLGGIGMASIGLALVVGSVGGCTVAQDALVARGCRKSCGFMIGLYSSITQFFMGIGSLVAGMIYSYRGDLVFGTAALALFAATIASIAILGVNALKGS